jgi:Subtilase family
VRSHGPIFQRLQNILNRQDAALQLRADPNSLAPERLLVFEVTGSVQNFAKAVARIAGLEFAGEEELEADEFDGNPEFYLLVPQLGALREIVSLWDRWQRDGTVPRNYTPWRDLFLQLRTVRPWGPVDRVSQANRNFFRHIIDGAPNNDLFRIEVELVFRPAVDASQSAEDEVSQRIVESGGRVVHRSYHSEFAYHALLVEIPASEIRRIAELDPASLAGVDPVASIIPQSIGTPIEAADQLDLDVSHPLPRNAEPIAAVFDALPVQAHPLLTGRLVIDDPEDLEARAVGPRIHGTAMASLVLHGDLNDSLSAISRRVYFRPVMYAPALGDEIFDNDRLVIDVIFEAVMRMRANGGQQVILVNLSLGDRTKPFSGKISTWARALDYLAFAYGILFLVSAGNVGDGIALIDFPDIPSFEGANLADRARAAFKGVDAVKSDRRVLAPGDSVNALTIGAWHRDSSQEVFNGTSPFPPYAGIDMPNLSSRLGPGLRRGAKPEALFAGGREHVRIDPVAAPPRLLSHPYPSRFWGLKVAAPQGVHFTVGTSAATALATHSAHRIFDALEDAYPQLIGPMPLFQRAVLLKALLVHSASWRGSQDFIRPIVDPTFSLHHEHWRREVCRHLGFGFVDPEDAIACAGERATMWATGTLGPEASLIFDVPVPNAVTTRATLREVRATLAWFTPIRPGHLAYRAVKLKIGSLEPASLQVAGVGTTTGQPSNSQSENGTIIHRRWIDSRVGDVTGGAKLPIQIQRERDQGTPVDEPIPFGVAVTIEMPGEVQVYDQVLANIQVKPRAIIRAQA